MLNHAKYTQVGRVLKLAHNVYDKAYYDYPAMNGGIEHEQKYPHIKPTITIHRYKVAQNENKIHKIF